MALMKMDFAVGESSLTPRTVYQSAVNVNANNTSINVTENKLYLATYDNQETANTTVLTNGNIMYREVSKGASWNNNFVYPKIIIFKATSSTISMTNTPAKVYGLTLTQLN